MIRLRSACIGYDGAEVLSNINLELLSGEFTVVIGKNGSGKSSLLRAAAGLLEYSGSITLGGEELSRIPKKSLAKRVSYLPQSRPVPVMDVQTLIEHGRFPHLGFSKILGAEDKRQAGYAAEAAGVKDLLRRDLSSLSGGERQRAYIAMTIAQDADMILLDEPTAHLDVEHQLEVVELLAALCEQGKGIVMAAHDLPQAFTYADRVCLLANSALAVCGSPGELCANALLEDSLGIRLKKSDDNDGIYSYRMTKKSGNEPDTK